MNEEELLQNKHLIFLNGLIVSSALQKTVKWIPKETLFSAQ